MAVRGTNLNNAAITTDNARCRGKKSHYGAIAQSHLGVIRKRLLSGLSDYKIHSTVLIYPT